MTDIRKQCTALYRLHRVYSCMLAWEQPEYASLLPEIRKGFEAVLDSGKLFAYVDSQQRAVLASGLEVSDDWLIAAGHCVRGEPLGAFERGRLLIALDEMTPKLKRLFVAGGASADGQEADPKAVSEPYELLLQAHQTMADESTNRMLAIAADASQSADDRMRAISEIDSRVYGWTSGKWADVLHVTDAAVRQTAFWRVDRPRILRPE